MNAIIGIPLEHSMSPVLHNEMYRLLDIETELIKDEYKDITSLVDRIKNNPYDLTAVTMPYKESIISLLDEVDAEAREIGSVNTVVNNLIVLYCENFVLSPKKWSAMSEQEKKEMTKLFNECPGLPLPQDLTKKRNFDLFI